MILAIDIALRKTGVILLDDNQKIKFKDTLVIPPKIPQWAAINQIYSYFKLLSVSLPEGTSFVIEDVLSVVSVKTALAIHSARTAATLAIQHSCNQPNISYYSPNDVKLRYGGKRGAKKEELLSGLKKEFPQYGYTNLTEDEIDALGLALYHRYRQQDS